MQGFVGTCAVLKFVRTVVECVRDALSSGIEQQRESILQHEGFSSALLWLVRDVASPLVYERALPRDGRVCDRALALLAATAELYETIADASADDDGGADGRAGRDDRRNGAASAQQLVAEDQLRSTAMVLLERALRDDVLQRLRFLLEYSARKVASDDDVPPYMQKHGAYVAQLLTFLVHWQVRRGCKRPPRNACERLRVPARSRVARVRMRVFLCVCLCVTVAAAARA